MAGTIPLSMTQQFDIYGKPLSGGQLYIMQAGTVSTPQNAFQDTALTIALPYPIPLDAAGRVPQFFLADGSVKIRLQDRFGVVLLAADSVLVIGPSAGGGGGSTVDPTQLIKTGMMMFAHDIDQIAGFVRLNGRSIGNASSGGTERPNADTQALFLHLWAKDTSLILKDSGGTTVARTTAANDFSTNKNLALPDWRGYNLSALDDMGNTPAGRLGGYFANPTVLGSAGGAPSVALAAGHLPAHTHAGTTNAADRSLDHLHGGIPLIGTITSGGFVSAPGWVYVNSSATQNTGGADRSLDHLHTFATTTSPGLNNTPFGSISPRKCVTFYMKL